MSVRLPLIQNYLAEQKDLRAALRFADLHEQEVVGEAGVYEALIPLGKPGAGEQYGYQVDLDACTGCKACVVGCNRMNGLDPGETWRSVGLIHGGSAENPLQQTVTTACHHCLDPACMNGCPVGAYEKDPTTGIVKHLDDQCIGCQYCTLTCPYEVPQYNSRLGIVRKCDMCSDRLAASEAPACVQSCPNGAISIRLVDRAETLEAAQSNAFLPGAPSPGITVPTTTFVSERALPRNVLPADFYSVRPAERHLPLVVMLVLTQLSAGAYALESLFSLRAGDSGGGLVDQAHSLLALSLGLLALGAATLHLGRPLYAFRAFLGLRKSWMSREIIAFGLFVKLAILDAVVSLRPDLLQTGLEALSFPIALPELGLFLSAATALVGILAVYCSAMIYVATRRVFWNQTSTLARFFGTSAVLGFGSMLLVASFVERLSGTSSERSILQGLTIGWMVASGLKLLFESRIFLHLRETQQGDLKRSAMLMTRELKDTTTLRYVLGGTGGLVIPSLLVIGAPRALSNAGLFATTVAFLLVFAGEFAERVLFFRAVSAPRMPGAAGK